MVLVANVRKQRGTKETEKLARSSVEERTIGVR